MHLVSSSVPNLPLKNVTVVDQHGNLLSKTDESDANTGLDPSQLKYVQALEQSYISASRQFFRPSSERKMYVRRLRQISISAQSEQTSEIYKPNQNPGDSAVRSQQTSESTQAGSDRGRGAGGTFESAPSAGNRSDHHASHRARQRRPTRCPRLECSQPPVERPSVPAPPTNTRKDATTNYEVDKTIQHIRKPVGGVKRLSVAVVVNYRKVTDQSGSVRA